MGNFNWGIVGLFILTACGQTVSRDALNVVPSSNPIVVDPGSGQDPGSPFGESIGTLGYAVHVNRSIINLGLDEQENNFVQATALFFALIPII
jgi:hypothetical protein